MSQIMRSWLSLASIGSGIIHLALVANSPLLLALPLVLLGLAELTWAVTVLVKDRLVVPRIAQATAIAPLILWSLLVVTATLLGAPQITTALRFLPMLIGASFELFIAGMLSVQLRRRADDETSPAQTVGAARYLSAMLVGGLLVGALTTPALAATEAGTVALEHGGTMGGMMMDLPEMGDH